MKRLTMSFTRWTAGCALLAALVLGTASGSWAAPRGDPIPGEPIFLPLISHNSPAPVYPNAPNVNAPYFPGDVPFSQAAVFWFGRVNRTENYTDVRVGYNDQELYLTTSSFDRRLWHDDTPSPSDLTLWDSVTVYVDTGGNTGNAPRTSSYQFTLQLSQQIDSSAYELSARGDGAGWAIQTVDFYSRPGWRGLILNDNTDDRGWNATFKIPFASLGLAAPPAQGTRWGLALAVHDQDDAAGTPIADKVWPPTMSTSAPGTWGQVSFGLPTYTPPSVPSSEVTTIRHRLDGITVQDASVGGSTYCGDGTDFWTEWGDTPETFYNPDHEDFNVQNQADVSDWPCFSKAYLTFPLDAIPPGAAVLSASLTLHQFGNSGAPGQAQRSLIHVLTVNQSWSETGLTWNNAPLAWENVSRQWVEPLETTFPGWPGIPYTWDVSYAAAWALQNGQPLRLALYSSDGAQHSGKYFSSSDTGDWNAVARPTVIITWGE